MTVCLITCNGAVFLERQLLSIIQQTRAPDEIILVDDASEDATYEIGLSLLSEYKGEVTSVKHEKRWGINKSFEHAINLASGDVIAFSDQDDCWNSGRLETIHNKFSRSDTELVLVNADIQVDGVKNGKTIFDYYPPTSSFTKNFLKNRFTGCQMAVRNHLMASIDVMPPDHVCYYDHYISLIALLRGAPEIIEESQGAYFRHSSNVTNMEKSRGLLTLLKARLALGIFFLSKVGRHFNNRF